MSDDFGGGHEMAVPEATGELRPRSLPWNPTDALGYGWARVKADPFVILVLGVGWLVMNGFTIISNVLQAATQDAHGDVQMIVGLLAAVFGILNFFVATFVTMGWITYILKLLRGEQAMLGDLFSGGPYGRMLGATFVYTIVMLLGCCALLIPGLIVAIGWGFYAYLIMDRDVLAMDSLRGSWALVREQWWPLLAFIVLSVLLQLAGLLFCGIGIFVTIPITSIAYGWIYMRLTGQEPVSVDAPLLE